MGKLHENIIATTLYIPIYQNKINHMDLHAFLYVKIHIYIFS